MAIAGQSQDFVDKHCIPTCWLLHRSQHWAGIGGGVGNLTWRIPAIIAQTEVSPLRGGSSADLPRVPVDQPAIAEYVDHSWYEYSREAAAHLIRNPGRTPTQPPISTGTRHFVGSRYTDIDGSRPFRPDAGRLCLRQNR
jgi:hypothetical protein